MRAEVSKPESPVPVPLSAFSLVVSCSHVRNTSGLGAQKTWHSLGNTNARQVPAALGRCMFCNNGPDQAFTEGQQNPTAEFRRTHKSVWSHTNSGRGQVQVGTRAIGGR